MLRTAVLVGAIASLSLAQPALAGDDVSAAISSADLSRPAKLIGFDGGQKLLSTSKRLRIWRPAIYYRLTVDESGTPTSCELTQKFRRNFVNTSLCAILIDHHTFSPAQDSGGNPVAGSYSSSISYVDLRKAS